MMPSLDGAAQRIPVVAALVSIQPTAFPAGVAHPA